MPNTGNPIELLVKISADTAGSKAGLQTQLDKLSKQLAGLNVGIKIDDSGFKKATTAAEGTNQQFMKLIRSQKAYTVESTKMGSAGDVAASKISGAFGKLSQQAVQSIADMKKLHQATGKDFTIKTDIKVENGVRVLKGMQVDVKQTEDVIERITYKLTRLNKLGTMSFEQSSVKQIDAKAFNMSKGFNKVTTDLENLRRQGKITQVSFDEFNKILAKIDNTAGFKKITKDIKDAAAFQKNLRDGLNEQTLAQERLNKALERHVSMQRLTQEQANKFKSNINTHNDINNLKQQETLMQQQVATNKRNNQALKEQTALQEKIRKLTIDITSAQRKNPNTLGRNQELVQMQAALASISPSSAGAAQSVARLSNQFQVLKAESTEASRSSIGVMESFKVAMTKFPIWMAASTAFYGTLRGINSAITQIIEIDSQMTVLKRVSGGQMEVNDVLRESIKLAGELGNAIADVNEGFIAFARQGFRGQELTDMAQYATLLGNISDMSVEESSSVLTAAIKGFNIEASNAIRVVDALNETDNNFAITTNQLSAALMRSAGAASTYGISLEKSIGYTTAIGQVSRESGSIIGNSLKSIYSRITSIPKAIEAMADIGISIHDSAGNMREVENVLDDLGAKWKTLSAEQQQNLGLQVAGRYQLSRFLILMEQYETALSATETALNSSGSGYRENTEYLKSYQAQINKVKNAWTEAVISMRDNGMGDGIVTALQAGLGFFKVLGKVVELVGVLPALLGTTGLAFLLFSKNAGIASTILNGTFISGLLKVPLVGGKVVGSLSAMSIGMQRFATGTGLAAASVGVLRTALSFVVPIAAFMALGAVISAVTSKIVEQKKAQKELKEEAEKNAQTDIDAITVNKNQVDELIASYKELSEKKKTGEWNTVNEKEYLSVQKELSELFPSLIGGINDKGEAHLIAADRVQEEVDKTNELLVAKQALIVQNAKEDYKKSINAIKDESSEIKKLKKELAEAIKLKKDFEKGARNTRTDRAANEGIFSLEQAETKVKEIEKSIILQGKTLAGAYSSLRSDIEKVTLADFSISSDKIVPEIQSMMQDVQRELDFSKVDIKEFDADKLNTIQREITEFGARMSSAISGGNKNDYISAKKELLEYLKVKGIERDTIRDLIPAYDVMASTVEASTNAKKEGSKVDDQLIVTSDELEGQTADLKDAIDNLTGSTQSQIDDTTGLMWQYELLSTRLSLLSEGTEEYASVSDQLSSVAGSLLSIYPSLSEEGLRLIDVYEELAQGSYANVSSSTELIAAKERLLQMFPELEKAEISRVNMIQSIVKNIATEKEANDILRKAYGALADGKLTSEETMTLAQLENTNARIKNINTEIEATSKLASAYSADYERVKAAAEAGDEGAGRALMRMSVPIGKLQTLTAELASATAEGAKYTNVLKASENVMGESTKSTEKKTKAEKDAAKAMEQSAFIADKYKRSLELLSLEIKKQQDIQSNFPTYSNEHQKALQSELKLQQDKKTLLIEQTKALEAQIKAGKILQTGVVTSSSGGDTVQPSGFGGTITSPFGTRTPPKTGASSDHQGIDIAGKNGTRVDSIVSGTVTYAGDKGNGLGNYVAIKDADGNTSIYGHLEKVLVKAGQSIAAGIGIGTIGSTGISSGNHLHYQKNDSNGKAIDPTNDVNEARKGISTASKEAAQVLSSIDSARSELIGLKGQIMEQDSVIASLENKAIGAQLDVFNHKRETYQRMLDIEAVKMDTLDKSSQRYVATLDRSTMFLEYKQAVNQQELVFLEQLRKSGTLSAISMDENKVSIDNLKIAMMSLNLVIQQTAAAKIDSIMAGFAERLDDLDYASQRSQVITSLLSEGSAEYANEIKFQIDKLQESKKEILNQKEALEKLIKTENLSIEKVKEYKEQLEDLSLAYLNVDVQTKRLKDSTNAFIADTLSKMKDEHISGLKKESERIVESIENAIKSTEDYYDSLIDKQKERLDAMDEEIEKEDRLKALREIDDEISKTKSDKRFSYITADGEEILTYNKERVSELEKQRAEMLKQYEREDIKKSIQDEIARLEKARTDKIEILRKEIEDTKARYDQLIATEETKWNGLIESAKNGTLAFDTLMNEFYGTSLINLQSYVAESQAQIQAIKDAYASLASFEVSLPPTSGGGSSGGSSSGSSGGSSNPLGMSDADYDRYVWNKERYVNNTNRDQAVEENQRLRDRYDITGDNYSLDELKKYHDGGIVGKAKPSRLTELTNKLFNVKPGEQVVKSLIGEIQIPPRNIPNLFANINNMLGSIIPKQAPMQPAGDIYHLNGIVIKADNPKQLFDNLDMYIRMNKS